MIKKWIFILSFCWAFSTQAAVEVIFFEKLGLQGSSLYNQVGLLNKFYGITHTDLPGTKDSAVFLAGHLQTTQNRTLAVIINAEILPQLDNKNMPKVLRKLAPNVPIIISNVRANTDLEALQTWTGESISAIKDQKSFTGHYFIHKHSITQQLAEQKVVWQHSDISWLQLSQSAQVETIIQLESEKEAPQPIFIKAQHQNLNVFVASYIQPEPFAGARIWRLDTRRFLQIAPLMLLMQSTCGEYCWHMPKQFANLTVDAPWLTESYGPLNFQGLLKEMQKAKFHTTIGFIPWNYDRSEAEAIKIFKENAEHYSLCMHGNNHNHREFYKYETDAHDPWPAKPLELHDFNLQQGLARLEKFQQLTGLKYDPVMVFPHNIAPEETLNLLKKYNFLATVNSNSIPLGSPTPTDPLFYFRPVSTQFANFPSLARTEPTEYPAAQIALDVYMGNPILFYEHILYFSEGLDAFNEVADYVNRLQPDVQWAGLGEIAQHLYLQRKVGDNEYEVNALGRLLKFNNSQKQSVKYTVLKNITPGEQVSAIYRNDKPQSLKYNKGDKYFSVSFDVPPEETHVLDIKYRNELDLSKIDLAKNDSAINQLRWLSDFRDMTLASSGLGRAFIQWYYGSDTYKGGLGQLLFFIMCIIVVFVLLLWFVVRYFRRTKTA